MFGKRKKVEALLAQSVYEDLSDDERRVLDAALAEDDVLREEADALRRMVDAIPVDPVQFEGDLRPALARALEQRDHRQPRGLPIPHWALAAAAFVLVAGGVIYWIAVHPPAAVAPGVTQDTALDRREPELAAALARSDRLIEQRQYARAYAVLAEAVARSPREGAAARAYQRMADLAFEELQWYDEAFDGYDTLRRSHAAQFRNDPDNFLRLNLLDEARGPAGEFTSLRALDAAKREGTFAALEQVVAQYPATYVASLASEELARVVGDEAGLAPGGEDQVRAMQMAQQRTGNPIVKTQLKLETAHVMDRKLGNESDARKIYEEVAGGSITVLAKLAEKRLAEMDPESGSGRP